MDAQSLIAGVAALGVGRAAMGEFRLGFLFGLMPRHGSLRSAGAARFVFCVHGGLGFDARAALAPFFFVRTSATGWRGAAARANNFGGDWADRDLDLAGLVGGV